MTTSFISRFVPLYLHCTPLARVCAPAASERASPPDRLGPPEPRGRRRGCCCNCSARTRRRHNQINVTRLAKLCIREGAALQSLEEGAGREKCLCELNTDALNMRKYAASLPFALPTFPPMFCSSVCIPSTFRFIARPLHLSSLPLSLLRLLL